MSFDDQLGAVEPFCIPKNSLLETPFMLESLLQ